MGDTTLVVCPDTSLINPEVLCPAIFDPVCGCDNVTYSNSCVALNAFGVSVFTDGECLTTSVIDMDDDVFSVYPNPAADHIQIGFKTGVSGMLRVLDVSGRLVMEKKLSGERVHTLFVGELIAGQYIIQVIDPLKAVQYKRFVKG